MYDFHAFKVGQGNFLVAHCVIDSIDHSMSILAELQKVAQKQLGFGHATFELEVKGQYDESQNHLSLGGQMKCAHWDLQGKIA